MFSPHLFLILYQQSGIQPNMRAKGVKGQAKENLGQEPVVLRLGKNSQATRHSGTKPLRRSSPLQPGESTGAMLG